MTRKRKPVFGVGINDADYFVNPLVDGKRKLCPFYSKWHDMIRRCYSEVSQKTRPTYVGCVVCEDWKTFSKFKAWMETQTWESRDLDKDLLGDGRLYSPETCLFIPHKINSFTLDSGSIRGELPIGVSQRRGKFNAYVRDPFKERSKSFINLGAFATPEEAHQAWRAAKIELGNKLIASIPDEPRAILGLRRYLENLA